MKFCLLTFVIVSVLCSEVALAGPSDDDQLNAPKPKPKPKPKRKQHQPTPAPAPGIVPTTKPTPAPAPSPTSSCNGVVVNDVCIRTGNLRFTLTWTNAGDMDLHVKPPCGDQIVFYDPHSCGGELDADDEEGTGPENIVWATGTAPSGTYYICVNPYDSDLAGSAYDLQVFHEGSLLQQFTGNAQLDDDGDDYYGYGSIVCSSTNYHHSVNVVATTAMEETMEYSGSDKFVSGSVVTVLGTITLAVVGLFVAVFMNYRTKESSDAVELSASSNVLLEEVPEVSSPNRETENMLL